MMPIFTDTYMRHSGQGDLFNTDKTLTRHFHDYKENNASKVLFYEATFSQYGPSSYVAQMC